MGESAVLDPIFALSLLLAAGFALATVARLIRLPSVTGYIVAGIGLGPTGLGLLSDELLGTHLQIFTTIALLLIAFGIGERFDLQQLKRSARSVAAVSAGESVGTFVLVAVSVGIVASSVSSGEAAPTLASAVAVALVCASIAVATAPAATVAVIREMEATGPISRLLLSSVVVNNVLSIMLFGITVAVARVLVGTATGAHVAQILVPVAETLVAVALGLAIGLFTDILVHKLSSRSDVLVVALATVLLCGGLASFLGVSPLLVGVAAGFAVVNRDRRDVRAFRALNDFEPPLYGIFFALAGAQLHLHELIAAGAVGVVFVVGRAAGKYFGAWLGATLSGMPREHATSVGLGLLPQAGLAIGLAYLVRQDPTLEPIRSMVINVVVASVVVNELLGPPLVRWTLLRAGERASASHPESLEVPASELNGVDIVKWTWPKLEPAPRQKGFVIGALSHPVTARGITRMAVLLSHHYGAQPLGVHVATGQPDDSFWSPDLDRYPVELFRTARDEAQSMGYQIQNEVEFAGEVSAGLLRVAETQNAQAIVMGHPLTQRSRRLGRIVDAVARDALCPVIVVKFAGAFHTERILVPLSSPDDFISLRPLICALGLVSEHQITLLRLMAPETAKEELDKGCDDLGGWALCEGVPGQVNCRAVAAESRVHEIIEAAQDHDVIVMATTSRSGLRRVFFGSLAEDVAQRSPRPIILVRGGMEARSLAELTE